MCESSNGGEVCLYDASNTTGRVYDTLYSKPTYSGTYYGTNVGIDNTVNSTWNRDPDTYVYFWQFANYSGLGLGQAGGTKENWGDLSEANSWSSHCFSSNSTCPY
ncbi:hypothetical protein ACM01_13445 [Streptomyces viridochromogenes]|uniref:Uncharacterized protein n=1 Tax=Streptomyces viridochromogenes TaxID=1938 RepID=A0A0J7ZHJ1_STRVR|nr:peptidase inhibitor family I36 protein [Streptomyces viridochromogenes]KMS74608.1 hypothetical protein ACM01_13445 [Streptomyces viridochromogenes]KOG21237.1 hypothetical protein ADK35_16855 [Streptomyces viridochromogenes]KOG22924.1 hypothetical protein ADK36_10550 [Streptomyces viridochromogenes]